VPHVGQSFIQRLFIVELGRKRNFSTFGTRLAIFNFSVIFVYRIKSIEENYNGKNINEGIIWFKEFGSFQRIFGR